MSQIKACRRFIINWDMRSGLEHVQPTLNWTSGKVGATLYELKKGYDIRVMPTIHHTPLPYVSKTPWGNLTRRVPTGGANRLIANILARVGIGADGYVKTGEDKKKSAHREERAPVDVISGFTKSPGATEALPIFMAITRDGK